MVTYRNHPITEAFPALSDSDYETLKNDIKENGLLEPIWLDPKNRVIDGRHRLRACRELKIKPEFQETEYAEGDIPGVVVGLNLRRRHLNETQRAWVAAKLVPYFEKAGKVEDEKPSETGEDGEASANLRKKKPGRPRREENKSAAKAARVVGVGSRSVEDAKKVMDNGCDELHAALQSGQIAVSDAAKVSKEPKATQKKLLKMVAKGEAKHLRQALRMMRQAEQIKQIEAMDPAQGGYPVVVADPAWPYEARREDSTQRGQTPYPQMTLNEICKITIPAADDSILFLWVTNSHLVNGNAARVCGAWGYQPKTLLTWVKNRMGTGDWARSQTEHVVMAVRGHPKLKEVPSTVFEAAVGAHSEKPEEFYQLVERCTAGSKIELFARKDREGWFCHGHAVDQPIGTAEPAESEEPIEEPEVEAPVETKAKAKSNGKKRKPPKVVIGKAAEMSAPPVDGVMQPTADGLMKPTEADLAVAMQEAETAEAAARADELS
jgi:N6-adenosine-specific RNA methylase IME4